MLPTGFAIPRLRKLFQFFNYMLQLEGFNDIIASAWQKQINRNPLFVLAEKLRHVKRALVTLDNNHGNLSTNVQHIRHELHSVQQVIDSNITSSVNLPLLMAQERTLQHKLWRVISLEKNLAQQKSRVQWLEKGDKNTSFFFNNTKNR